MTTNPETEALVAEAAPIILSSGTVVEVERLRTRGLMALLKILTRGAADFLPELKFDSGTSQEAFTGQLIGTALLAIPEAVEETIGFINQMVSLPKQHGKLSGPAALAAAEAEVNFRAEMADPELDDLVTIMSEIIRVEAPHVMALGKRLGTLLESQQKNAIAKQSASSKNASEG